MQRTAKQRIARAAAALALFLTLAAGTASAQSTTVVVTPVEGDPTASGQELLDALAGLTDCSATKPCLVIIEPGIYDLEDESLEMKPYVDVQGSGREVTLITADGRAAFDEGTVVGADNCELRNLTVESRGAGTHYAAVGIFLSNVTTRISDVVVRATQGVGGSDGILIQGGSPVIQGTEVLAQGAPFTTGIAIEWKASALLNDTEVIAKGGSHTNRAILLLGHDSSIIELRNMRISARGGDHAVGVVWSSNNSGGRVRVEQSVISASGGIVDNRGIEIESPTFDVFLVSGSRLEAVGASSHAARSLAVGTPLRINNSRLGANTGTAIGSVSVGSSQLAGGPADAFVTCAGVYDESYTFYASTCP